MATGVILSRFQSLNVTMGFYPLKAMFGGWYSHHHYYALNIFREIGCKDVGIMAHFMLYGGNLKQQYHTFISAGHLLFKFSPYSIKKMF